MENSNPDNVVLSHGSCSNIESEYYPPHHPQHWMRGWAGKYCWHWHRHGIMGRRFPDVGLLRYRKWVPQQLWDVNKQRSGDSRPIGARHSNTAANHMDYSSGVVDGEIIYGGTRWIEDNCSATFSEYIFLFPACLMISHWLTKNAELNSVF